MPWVDLADTFETESKGIKVVLPGGKVEIFEVSGNCPRLKGQVFNKSYKYDNGGQLQIYAAIGDNWVTLAHFPAGTWQYVVPL